MCDDLLNEYYTKYKLNVGHREITLANAILFTHSLADLHAKMLEFIGMVIPDYWMN
jgi:hypothetical protein